MIGAVSGVQPTSRPSSLRPSNVNVRFTSRIGNANSIVGIVSGGVYALIALGLTLIFSVLGFANFALAARNLPPHLQKKAIAWGTVGAIVVLRALMRP